MTALDHTFNGIGYRVDLPAFGQRDRVELVSGSFRLIHRDQRSAILGNGEHPEKRWVVYDLDALELAA